jgi:hypothetical protein
VLNSITHEPVDRALVYSADGVYATFTDDHGHFELALTGPKAEVGQSIGYNPTMLLVKKPGFFSGASRPGFGLVTSGEREVSLTLVPEALIVGRVKFPTAESADHVRVQLYRREVREGFAQWTPMGATETRADGEYRFAGLRAGDYKLFTREAVEQDPLTAPNDPVFAFPPRYFAAARDFATSDAIQVRAGQSFTANFALERQRYYDVRIPVVGTEPGAPGLGVSVFAQGHRGPGFELGYSRSQAAIVGSLPNGNYTIEASGFGQNATTGMVNITVANAPVNGPGLAVTPNTSIEVNIHQDMTGADSGHAQPENLPPNQPAAYVSLVSAEEVPNRRSRGGQYQAQGNPAVLGGVAPSRYWVQVQGVMGYAASVSSGGRDLLHLPLIVPYGASVPPIDVNMRYDAGEIDVTVARPTVQSAALAKGDATNRTNLSPAFAQPEGLSVYCVAVGNGTMRESHSWSNGQYVLEQLAPGDYRVLAFDTPQQFEYRNPVAMRAYESKGQVVHVAAGQKAQVRVQVIESE